MSLEFTEYRYPRAIYGALPQLVHGQEVTTQQVEIGGTSAQSAAFNERTQLIVVSAVSADCRIAIGAEPTADNDGAGISRLLSAGNEYAFDVAGGAKIAVIQAAP